MKIVFYELPEIAAVRSVCDRAGLDYGETKEDGPRTYNSITVEDGWRLVECMRDRDPEFARYIRFACEDAHKKDPQFPLAHFDGTRYQWAGLPLEHSS